MRRSTRGRFRAAWRAALVGMACGVLSAPLAAQVLENGAIRSEAGRSDEDLSAARGQVEVTPVARDEEIRNRLQSILEATGWFREPRVQVDKGVVFLDGETDTVELRRWAGDLARNTRDVAAVVNRMEVIEPLVWDFGPAWRGLLGLWLDTVRAIPFIVFGLTVLAISIGLGVLVTRAMRLVLRRRIRARLLRNVLARGIGVLVVVAGAYIILRVAGLTQLALTVIGGTGLIGLALGIAFRDITENFLASIFLSMQKPFETGDLVEVLGVTGYVQQMNMRTTMVMTLEGNLVQIPNASVYKNTVRNFTTNANRREDFVVGIGYETPITAAQEIARNVLAEHPAVLNEPEPSVLVDGLGRSSVNLRVYFWLNGREHSWLKVRSSVIRLVKRAFQQHGISMPDEAREVVFPQGVPVTVLDQRPQEPRAARPEQPPEPERAGEELDTVTTKAEAGLYSEAGVIEQQVRHMRPLPQEDNLLRGAEDGQATAG